jgi:hypothetical protein
MNLPTWATARLAFGMGDEQDASSTVPTSETEVWGTRKLDGSLMKSLVGEFLLDTDT